MNEVEINLENIVGKKELLKLFGEVFELGGPNGNVSCSAGDTKGWGFNWDALDESLGLLDANGIWGTSRKFTFPLQINVTNYKKFEQDHPDEFQTLIEILAGKIEQYKKHGMEFEFKLQE